MLCVECSSPMEPRNGMWVCDNCFNAVPGEAFGDNTVLEEGVTLYDAVGRSEEQW